MPDVEFSTQESCDEHALLLGNDAHAFPFGELRENLLIHENTKSLDPDVGHSTETVHTQ